jgi:hypothetical protein
LIFYLLRYNHKTLTYVQRKIAQSFVPPSIEAHYPYISLYIHRSEYEIQQSTSLKEYFHLFYDHSIKGNITNIFINSNDQNIFKEFKELNQNKSNHYKLLNMKMKKILSFNTTYSMSKEIHLDLLTNLYIEVHAHLHSGTLTSNYCRLIDALRLVLGKTIPFYTPDNRYLAY